jgi:hypothetical protein
MPHRQRPDRRRLLAAALVVVGLLLTGLVPAQAADPAPTLITGTVVGSSGEPEWGFYVTNWPRTDTQQTMKDGTYVLEVRPGRNVVRLLTDSYQPYSVDVVAVEGETVVAPNILVKPGHTLTGDVVDESGEPIDVTVTVRGDGWRRSAQTVAGHVEIQGLPAGRVTVGVTGYYVLTLTQSTWISSSSPNELGRVVVQRSVPIKGSVWVLANVNKSDGVAFQAQAFAAEAGEPVGPALATTQTGPFHTDTGRSNAFFTLAVPHRRNYIVQIRALEPSGRGPVAASYKVTARSEEDAWVPYTFAAFGRPLTGTVRTSTFDLVRSETLLVGQVPCSGDLREPASSLGVPISRDGTFTAPTVAGKCYGFDLQGSSVELVPRRVRAGGDTAVVVHPLYFTRIVPTIVMRSGGWLNARVAIDTDGGLWAPAVSAGKLSVYKGSRLLGSRQVTSGRATVALEPRLAIGKHHLRLVYSGSQAHERATFEADFVVASRS